MKHNVWREVGRGILTSQFAFKNTLSFLVQLDLSDTRSESKKTLKNMKTINIQGSTL